MKKYIFNDKKEMEIFLSVERVLDKNIFPEMTKIEKEEINFLNKNIKKGENILEIGCGGGRVLKKIKKGIKISGTEINKLFIDYCKNNILNVFYLNALKKVPKDKKGLYDLVFISYNTFYNFPKKDRLKIINHSNNLLRDKGKLVLTFFNVDKINFKIQEEMLEYYRRVINVSRDFNIKFLVKNDERGICLKKGKKILWFSRWKTDKEIFQESRNWKNFNLNETKIGKKSVASFVVLKKN